MPCINVLYVFLPILIYYQYVSVFIFIYIWGLRHTVFASSVPAAAAVPSISLSSVCGPSNPLSWSCRLCRRAAKNGTGSSDWPLNAERVVSA